MSRGLTGVAAIEVAKALGTEPITILEIDWPAVTKYADKDYSGIGGKILSVSGLDSAMKFGGTGVVGSISVTLDDSDGTIKALMSTTDVHKRPVNVYQAYAALAETDKFLVFTGEISSPFTWNEGTRQVSFDVVTRIEDTEIGFSPEQSDFDFISDAANGVAWPLVFGTSVRVPSVRLTEQVRGTSLSRFGAITQADLNTLCSNADAFANADIAKTIADANPGVTDENYETLIDALSSTSTALFTFIESLFFDSPEQETQVEAYKDTCISIALETRNQTLYAGNVIAADVQIDTLDVTIAGLEAQILAEEAKPLEGTGDEPWRDLALLAQLEVSLAAAESELGDAQTTKQNNLVSLLATNSTLASLEVTKTTLTTTILIFFPSTLLVEGGEDFPQSTPVNIIINGLRLAGSFSGQTFTVSNSRLPTEVNVQLAARENDNPNEFWIEDSTLQLKNKYCLIGGRWIIFVQNQDGNRCYFAPIVYEKTGEVTNGIDVREIYDPKLLTGFIQQTVVLMPEAWLGLVRSQSDNPDWANGLSNIANTDYSIEIGDIVYLDGEYKDLYIANLIPSTAVHEVAAFRVINGVRTLVPVPSRYYEVDLSESIAGQSATTIRFVRPLGQYNGEEWEEDIFVTLTSTVGPNTADIISYLLTTYSALTPDATTFAAVSAAIDEYPSHFPLLERVDTMATIERIAWQARCAAYIKGSTVYLKYLSAEEAALDTLTEADILRESFALEFTPTEDLVTKFTALWTKDHSEPEKLKFTIRNNTARYGDIEQEYDFFIYNVQALVEKSITFWSIRYSNTWKIVTFRTALTKLDFESLDTIALTLVDELIGTGTIKGVVESATFNSEADEIIFKVMTEVRIGELLPFTFFWPSTVTPGLIYTGSP